MQRHGQAKVAKAEAAQGQTIINQKVAAKMFKYNFECHFEHHVVAAKEQEAAVCGCDNSCNGVGSQQRQARGQATVAKSRGSARADNNQPKSRSNTSKNGADGGRDSGSHGSGSGSGSGGNGGDDAAAMAVVT